ncbi:hypothetical protein BKA70DRAFT_1069481, partial [Coprinopsis sp. MPI-PUGE-AT-0042]
EERLSTKMIDPLKFKAEMLLEAGIPYFGDSLSDTTWRKDRFHVFRTEKAYVIMDNELNMDSIELPWELIVQPKFELAEWYNTRLRKLMGGRKNFGECKDHEEIGDVLAWEIERTLGDNGPYPGEV